MSTRSFARALTMLGAFATVSAAAQTSLTIYSTARPGGVPPELYRSTATTTTQPWIEIPGHAMVGEIRSITLQRGTNRLSFGNIAEHMDPTTFVLESLTAPESVRIVEHAFRYDLITTEKLLSRYVGETITVHPSGDDQGAPLTGRLLGTQGGLILEAPDGQIHSVDEYGRIVFPALPEGLITRPTLASEVVSDHAGEHSVRLSYQTAGITWWADYNAVYAPGNDPNVGTIDLSAWASIVNRSGASFHNARLKLLAGDVNRVEPAAMSARRVFAVMEQAADVAGFEERSFAQLHLYTLGRPVTLEDDATVQIELIEPVKRAPARKRLVYAPIRGFYGSGPRPIVEPDYGLAVNTQVDVYLELENRRNLGMGVPLPAGRFRVSELDPSDGTLQLVGEDVIDHTPEDERVRVRLGSAFDIVGERRQVDFSVNYDREQMEEAIEIRVRNRGSRPVEVQVRETLFRWAENDVLQSSHRYEREDARTILFPLQVDARGETVLTYRVRYSW